MIEKKITNLKMITRKNIILQKGNEIIVKLRKKNVTYKKGVLFNNKITNLKKINYYQKNDFAKRLKVSSKNYNI